MHQSMRNRCVLVSPEDLAAAVGSAVTIESENGMVARKGRESLYGAFRDICPQASMSDGPSRRLKGRISAPAFNKIMSSKCSFKCARSRKKNISSSAGNWVFVGRRWLNPLDEADRSVLEHNYDVLTSKFPAGTISPKKIFMRTLTEISSAWAKRCGETSQSLVDHHKIFIEQSTQQPMYSDFSLFDYTGGLCHTNSNPWSSIESRSSDNSDSDDLDEDASGSTTPSFNAAWDAAHDGLSPPPADHHFPDSLLLRGADCPRNAGQEMDFALHLHWACARTLSVDAVELEHFARSRSF